MGQLGADVEHLDRIARSFQEESKRITAVATTLTSDITAAWWKGNDQAKFVSEWNATNAPTIKRVAAMLRAQCEALRRQADQQREASGDGGGAGPSPGSGSGPPKPGESSGNPTGNHPADPRSSKTSAELDNGIVKASVSNETYGNGDGPGTYTNGSASWEAGDGTFKGKAEGEAAWGWGTVGRADVDVLDGVATSKSAYRAQAGAGADGKATIEFDGSELRGQAKGEAWVGGRLKGTNETTLFDGTFKSTSEGTILLGGRAGGQADFKINPYGVTGEAKGEAFVGAEARLKQDFDAFSGLYKQTTELSAQAGAGASAKATGHVGLDGVYGGGKAEAWAGWRVGGKTQTGILNDHITTGGEIGLRGGVGAKAGAETYLTADKVGLQLELGAALGFGGDLSVNFAFSPTGLLNDATHFQNNVVDKVTGGVQNIGEGAGKVWDTITPW